LFLLLDRLSVVPESLAEEEKLEIGVEEGESLVVKGAIDERKSIEVGLVERVFRHLTVLENV